MEDDYDPMKDPSNYFKDPWHPLGKYILYHYSKDPRFGRLRFVDCGNLLYFNKTIPVGVYKTDHETDNKFRRVVLMHYDLTGNEVCEVYDCNYLRCAPWTDTGKPYNYVNNPVSEFRVSIDDVFLCEDFDFEDKLERGTRIYEVMWRFGLVWSWGWGHYNQVVGDPLFRAHHEFCVDRCDNGSYWTFEDAYLKVAAIPGDRMDSKDPVDQQRACREVFVETQKQLARVSASINAELYLWDETVNVKAKPVHYRQL